MRFLMLSVLALVGCGGHALLRGTESGTAGSGGATTAVGGQAGGAAGAPDATAGAGGADAATVVDAAGGDAAPDAVDGGAAACALRIVEVRALDQNGDGVFDTPEQATVRVVVENRGGAVGPVVVRVTSDDERVLPQGSAESRVPSIASGGQEALAVAFAIPKEVWFGSEIGFTITAGLADDPTCTAPAVEPTVVTTGDLRDREICDATRQIEISHVVVEGAGASGRIEPGADLTFEAVMTNPGPWDQFWYPFVRLVSDDPGITLTGPDGLYALPSGLSFPLSMGLHVDAAVPHGTLVHLTASAGAAQVRCRRVRTLDVPLLVE